MKYKAKIEIELVYDLDEFGPTSESLKSMIRSNLDFVLQDGSIDLTVLQAEVFDELDEDIEPLSYRDKITIERNG